MKKIFVNGSFDILHSGHIKLLNYAKSLGDYLLVAIDTDSRIAKLKGCSRPINCLYSRRLLLENLKSVDQVEVFDTDDDLINILRDYSPDIMVKGSDWGTGPLIGEQHCKKILFYERQDNASTTAIIERVLSAYK